MSYTPPAGSLLEFNFSASSAYTPPPGGAVDFPSFRPGVIGYAIRQLAITLTAQAAHGVQGGGYYALTLAPNIAAIQPATCEFRQYLNLSVSATGDVKTAGLVNSAIQVSGSASGPGMVFGAVGLPLPIYGLVTSSTATSGESHGSISIAATATGTETLSGMVAASFETHVSASGFVAPVGRASPSLGMTCFSSGSSGTSIAANAGISFRSSCRAFHGRTGRVSGMVSIRSAASGKHGVSGAAEGRPPLFSAASGSTMLSFVGAVNSDIGVSGHVQAETSEESQDICA